MAFELGKFQTAEQRRNAQQVAQADASGMQDSSLRGKQETAPLSMLGIGGQPLTNNQGRAERPLMPTDPASQKIQQGIFDKAFANFRANRGTTATGTEPLVTPAALAPLRCSHASSLGLMLLSRSRSRSGRIISAMPPRGPRPM